jgi:hypothetical protein
VGLPDVRRFPTASVWSQDGVIEVLFSGNERSTRLSIPVAKLGIIEDLEAAELRLLARLKELGYHVDRVSATS